MRFRPYKRQAWNLPCYTAPPVKGRSCNLPRQKRVKTAWACGYPAWKAFKETLLCPGGAAGASLGTPMRLCIRIADIVPTDLCYYYSVVYFCTKRCSLRFCTNCTCVQFVQTKVLHKKGRRVFQARARGKKGRRGPEAGEKHRRRQVGTRATTAAELFRAPRQYPRAEKQVRGLPGASPSAVPALLWPWAGRCRRLRA